MEDLSLQDIIAAHTKALADHLEEFLPLIRLLRLLSEGPVSPEHVATAMHWTPQQVEEVLQAWGRVVDAKGTIQTVAGAGCALDTLLFPMLIGRSSHVVATCPATGRLIRLTVTEQTIEELDPPGAVLSLRLRETNTSSF
jgi:alkylmercury lyase